MTAVADFSPRTLLLLLLFPVLILSYQPVISLGMAFGMNIDISLLYIYLGVVLCVFFPRIKQYITTVPHHPIWIVAIGYLGFSWLSVLWSPNPVRGAVTAAFLTTLLVTGLIIANNVALIHRYSKQLQHLLGAAFILLTFATLWQLISDAVGLQTFSWLPLMYRGDVFGFARATGFSLEPQFLGSLLLVPLIWSAYSLLRYPTSLTSAVFGISSLLLLLTLSRGALLAAVIGLIALFILVRPNIRKVLRVTTIGAITVAVWGTLIFSAATIRPDGISGYTALSGAISQLSFDKLDLPQEPKEADSTAPVVSAETEPGYVPESTESRLNMSASALNLWQSSPSYTLFGVGLGGFGAALADRESTNNISQVVNNHYIEQLAEIGIVGLALFVLLLTVTTWVAVRSKQYWLAALMFAFSTQWLFFSGIANVVHIWIIIGCIAGVHLHKSSKGSATITK